MHRVANYLFLSTRLGLCSITLGSIAMHGRLLLLQRMIWVVVPVALGRVYREECILKMLWLVFCGMQNYLAVMLLM